MVETLTRNSSARDRLLYQAAVDTDFRAELEADPGAFGTDGFEFDLPNSVQRQDDSFLEAVDDGMGGMDIFACIPTCSAGPITIICEGNTKGT